MKYFIYLKSVVLFVSIHILAYGREWNSVEGKTFEGEFISATEKAVEIRRDSDQKLFNVPLTKLSENDQEYAKKQKILQELNEAVICDSYKELMEVASKRKLYSYVYYYKSMSLESFDFVCNHIYRNEQFLRKAKGNFMIAMVREEDLEFEKAIDYKEGFKAGGEERLCEAWFYDKAHTLTLHRSIFYNKTSHESLMADRGQEAVAAEIELIIYHSIYVKMLNINGRKLNNKKR